MRILIIAITAAMIAASCTYNIYLPASPTTSHEEKPDWIDHYVPNDSDPVFSEPVHWFFDEAPKGLPIGNGVMLQGGDSVLIIEITDSLWINFQVDTTQSVWDTIYDLRPLK